MELLRSMFHHVMRERSKLWFVDLKRAPLPPVRNSRSLSSGKRPNVTQLPLRSIKSNTSLSLDHVAEIFKMLCRKLAFLSRYAYFLDEAIWLNKFAIFDRKNFSRIFRTKKEFIGQKIFLIEKLFLGEKIFFSLSEKLVCSKNCFFWPKNYSLD